MRSLLSDKNMQKSDDNTPWLIAGQGLAGSTLALELLSRGEAVYVVDARIPGASSTVAAGVFNPVTGKRMQVTWQAATLWPLLEQFYPQAERLLQTRFFYHLPNLRPLFTAEERTLAEKQARTGSLSAWMEVWDTPPWLPAEDVVAPYGVVAVPRSGFVEVMSFCKAVHRYLLERSSFEEARIKVEDVQPASEGVLWRGVICKGLIWADGFAGAQNPALAHLPLAPLKGELLRLSSDQPPVQAGGVLNRAGYLAPRPDGTLWAGSTYEHSYTTPSPTEEARTSILERVGRFYRPKLTVLEHLSGIRPSVRDRRPILGPLQDLPGQYVFTGMGTKGVSLGPWMAKTLADHLLTQAPIPAEVAPRTL